MPASIALAIAPGMDATSRPIRSTEPASTISTAETMNAPTASGYPPGGAAMLASKAEPGVDHAMLTGILRNRLSTMPHNPIATPTAINPDVACACVAPMASKPFTTTAKELAKPTKDAIAPAA